jgi:hypothetical protein
MTHHLALIQDAGPTFAAIATAIKAARHSVFVVGWDLDSRTVLRPEASCPEEARLRWRRSKFEHGTPTCTGGAISYAMRFRIGHGDDARWDAERWGFFSQDDVPSPSNWMRRCEHSS